MRFIIGEQGYEKRVSSGELRYDSGAVEKWRLTTAVSNYQFLRVDLDARQAPSKHSTLYHAVLNENGRLERLRYRFWGNDLKITGNVLFEPNLITASRELNGESLGEELTVSKQASFWFPSAMGFSLMAGAVNGTAVSLDTAFSNPLSVFSLFQTEVDLLWDEAEELNVGQKVVVGRPLQIKWLDQQRTIWLDEKNAVLKMDSSDGKTAVATRLIHYK